MRAMRAESFTGYGGLKLVEVPRPRRADGRVLVRITAAGVTPLDHTILSGGYLRATAPLILGNEAAGVVEDPGDSVFSEGARVMFAGPYGVAEDGTYSEWIAARDEGLCLIPDTIDDATAGGMPVAFLTAQITLTQAGFEPGKTVLAPAIGGAVGNAVTQLARAQGAGRERFRRRRARPKPSRHGRSASTMSSISLRRVSLMASLTSREAGAWMSSSTAWAVPDGSRARYACRRWCADLAGILGRTPDDGRCHGLDLETREHEGLLALRSIACDQSCRLGRHPATADLGTGKAHRRASVQAGRGRRSSPPSDRRPSVRQSGVEDVTQPTYSRSAVSFSQVVD
jgi:Alcohol dehydrogenase GroES-like domain